MTSETRHPAGQEPEREVSRDRQDEIREVGKEGTVSTHGGETSLGTTPIGLGSVEPVGGHREASDRIMGESTEEAPDRRDRDRR